MRQPELATNGVQTEATDRTNDEHGMPLNFKDNIKNSSDGLAAAQEAEKRTKDSHNARNQAELLTLYAPRPGHGQGQMPIPRPGHGHGQEHG